MVIGPVASAGACPTLSSHGKGCPGLPFCAGSPQVAGHTPFPQCHLSDGLCALPWGAWCVPQLARWETAGETPVTRLPPGLRPGVSSGPTQRAEARQPPGASMVLGPRGTVAGRHSGYAAFQDWAHHQPNPSFPISQIPPPEAGETSQGTEGEGREQRQPMGGRQDPSSRAGGPGVQWEVRAAWE